MAHIIVPFDKTFERKTFDCGVPALNRYLKEQANQDIRNHYTVMFVALEEQTRKIIGFYTLSNAGVALDAIPAEMKAKLPKYPEVPAIRIGRLAVDKSVRRHKLGSELLANAINKSMSNVTTGWAMMIVDAKNEQSAVFYKKFGFMEFYDDILHLFIMRRTLEDFLTSPILDEASGET
jgi:ribosomal protein S18 acetylase RimI-like enzyme